MTRPNLSQLGSAAVALAGAGLCIVPQDRDKRPLLGRGWIDAASCDPSRVAEWWRRWPSANVAAVLGPSGLVVVDVDRHEGGPDGFGTLAELEGRHGLLPPTVRVETGGGGAHCYFRTPAGLARSAVLGPGVELLAGRHAVTLPPSVHKSGRLYRWASREPLADLPASWAAVAMPPAPPPMTRMPRAVAVGDNYLRSALQGEVGRIVNAVPGTRDNTLVSAAYRIGRIIGAGIGAMDDVESSLVAAGVATGLDEHGVRDAVARALTAGAANPRRIERGGAA